MRKEYIKKRIVSLLPAVVLLLGVAPLSGVAAFGEETAPAEGVSPDATGDAEKVLRFDSRGEFKITIFADAHTEDKLKKTRKTRAFFILPA